MRDELNDGHIGSVNDEQSITPTTDSDPGDPIFSGLTLYDPFSRQYCSASGRNFIYGYGCYSISSTAAKVPAVFKLTLYPRCAAGMAANVIRVEIAFLMGTV